MGWVIGAEPDEIYVECDNDNLLKKNSCCVAIIFIIALVWAGRVKKYLSLRPELTILIPFFPCRNVRFGIGWLP
jgi:hypothetical protein